MAIVAKFVGPKDENGMPLSYHNGIPASDLSEEDFAALTDEEKATLAASPLYDLRRDAPKEAESAARRVERAEVPAASKKEG